MNCFYCIKLAIMIVSTMYLILVATISFATFISGIIGYYIQCSDKGIHTCAINNVSAVIISSAFTGLVISLLILFTCVIILVIIVWIILETKRYLCANVEQDDMSDDTLTNLLNDMSEDCIV